MWTAALRVLEITRLKRLELTRNYSYWLNLKPKNNFADFKHFQLKETLNFSKSANGITTAHNHCYFLWSWICCHLKRTIWDPNIIDSFPILQTRSSPSEVSDKTPCDGLHIPKSILVKTRYDNQKTSCWAGNWFLKGITPLLYPCSNLFLRQYYLLNWQLDKNSQHVKFFSFLLQLLILSESTSKYKKHVKKEFNISEVRSCAQLETELF